VLHSEEQLDFGLDLLIACSISSLALQGPEHSAPSILYLGGLFKQNAIKPIFWL